jgi:C4-dicarboxylate-specific signal transduction histidine kinase
LTPVSSVAVAAWLPAVAALCVIVGLATIVVLMRRQGRRRRALRALHSGADELEHDLKQCRAQLERAHASMSVAPGVPAAGEADAHAAIDAALRELLAHRLWLRDEAEHASQRELDAAVTAMGKARGALGQQLRELDSAQRPQ